MLKIWNKMIFFSLNESLKFKEKRILDIFHLFKQKKYLKQKKNIYFFLKAFANDEMPSTICYPCRLLMDFCYRFKQMCKKADTLLKQYPLTGTWPDRLEHPKFPVKLIQVWKNIFTIFPNEIFLFKISIKYQISTKICTRIKMQIIFQKNQKFINFILTI